MMPFFARPLERVDKLLLEAERVYTPAAYAAALAAVEALPQHEPAVVFRRASAMHGLAEFRGDLDLMRRVIAEYERAWRSGILPPKLARIMPELIEDCHDQIREAVDARRHAGERVRK